MTIGGWILLVVSLTAVWGLAGWCYWKILTGPAAPTDDED
jgi:hypothetical protein